MTQTFTFITFPACCLSWTLHAVPEHGVCNSLCTYLHTYVIVIAGARQDIKYPNIYYECFKALRSKIHIPCFCTMFPEWHGHKGCDFSFSCCQSGCSKQSSVLALIIIIFFTCDGHQHTTTQRNGNYAGALTIFSEYHNIVSVKVTYLYNGRSEQNSTKCDTDNI